MVSGLEKYQEQLRKQVQKYLEKNPMSMEQLSRKINISSLTVQIFMKKIPQVSGRTTMSSKVLNKIELFLDKEGIKP